MSAKHATPDFQNTSPSRSISTGWKRPFAACSNRHRKIVDLATLTYLLPTGAAELLVFFAAPSGFFLAAASFNSRDSFSTRCRITLPALNFTVARDGMTKLLP